MLTSAEIFRQFLDALFGHPSALSNTSLPVAAARPPTFKYVEIIIVAHSLGAVITRWAMLQARDGAKSWLPNLKLVLFAPAHMGASIVKLALSVVSGLPFLALATGVLRFKSPLIDQLNKGSDELRALQNDTKRALAAGNCDYLIAKKVIHAEYETIVSNMHFCSDPPAIPFVGDHFAICKPKAQFSDPVDHVLELL